MANYQVVNGVKTLNMHGKNYVEVAERVTQVHEAKAEFDILKSEPMQVADRWLWVSVITINGHQYMGNAEIKMNAAKNTPDGTNPFECAETSAIGRALGFAGFGSVESIASKDEIERGKPFNGAQEESKPVEKPAQEATPAARPAQTAPVSEKPAQPSKPDRAANVQGNPEVNRVKNQAINLGLVHNLAEWMVYKESVLRKQVKDVDLSEQQIATLRAALDIDKKQPVSQAS